MVPSNPAMAPHRTTRHISPTSTANISHRHKKALRAPARISRPSPIPMPSGLNVPWKTRAANLCRRVNAQTLFFFRLDPAYSPPKSPPAEPEYDELEDTELNARCLYAEANRLKTMVYERDRQIFWLVGRCAKLERQRKVPDEARIYMPRGNKKGRVSFSMLGRIIAELSPSDMLDGAVEIPVGDVGGSARWEFGINEAGKGVWKIVGTEVPDEDVEERERVRRVEFEEDREVREDGEKESGRRRERMPGSFCEDEVIEMEDE